MPIHTKNGSPMKAQINANITVFKYILSLGLNCNVSIIPIGNKE